LSLGICGPQKLDQASAGPLPGNSNDAKGSTAPSNERCQRLGGTADRRCWPRAAQHSKGASRPQAAVAAVEKQPLQFIRLPLCRVPADRFGRLERGASGAASCFAVRTLYRVVSASSRQPVRRYLHIRRRSIELLAVADEVESAIILACGLNASGPAVRLDAAIHLRFDPNISQKAQAGNRRRCRRDRRAAGRAVRPLLSAITSPGCGAR